MRREWCLLAAPIAVAGAIVALVVAGSAATADDVVRAVLVVLWAVAGVTLGVHRRLGRLGPIALFGALLGAAGTVAASLAEHRSLSSGADLLVDATVRMVPCLLAAAALAFLLCLPDGFFGRAGRLTTIVVFTTVAVVVGLALLADRDRVAVVPIVLLWAVALGVGVTAANQRYLRAAPLARRRMQWLGWGIAVGAEAAIVVVALNVVTDWPHHSGAIALALTGVVPLALIASSIPGLVARIDRLLAVTVSIAGLTALVVGLYLLVVLVMGRRPEGDEATFFLLSMLAAGVAAACYLPARRWLAGRANRLVYGERAAPDEALRAFGQRLTRAIPLDELVLQLTENLHRALDLSQAEVWTGADGRLGLAAAIPHRGADELQLGPAERTVVARAGVSGPSWLEVWLPDLVELNGTPVRIAPIAHRGELLGLIVLRRRDASAPFGADEDRLLGEVAHQLGLALHNAQLDVALQASLAELRVRNDELRASRARLVNAGDAERRKLERNLHDGAQQHLVAIAVKLRLVKDAVDDGEPDGTAMLDEIRGDVQAAVAELRALAHGIFPPLLASGGLVEALPALGSRSPLDVRTTFDDVARYGEDVEAAVYFCCSEALQNAAKHAGDDALVTVHVWHDDGVLHFEVSDDGAGFDPALVGRGGNGFVNMADRLGAIDGAVEVTSSPGAGTTVHGRVPVG